MTDTNDLKRTPLYDTHVELGGRMVPFGGWDMPVQYTGILDEARAVRSNAGIFDVSHMGRVIIRGPDAVVLLNRVLSVDVPKLRIRRARYGVICNVEGGIIDDAIVYRLGMQRYLLVPNASNADAVIDWLRRWQQDDGPGRDRVSVTDDLAMIALQGPAAPAHPVRADRPRRALDAAVQGRGDGRRGRALDHRPDRLHGRGRLRADGAVRRRGEDMAGAERRGRGPVRARGPGRAAARGRDCRSTATTSTSSTTRTRLGWAGSSTSTATGTSRREALTRLRDEEPERRLIGFDVIGRGIARQGFTLVAGGERVGEVTSGNYSPTLDSAIGMGYVRTEFSDPGTPLHVDVRGRLVEAEVTLLPFYAERQAPILAPIG